MDGSCDRWTQTLVMFYRAQLFEGPISALIMLGLVFRKAINLIQDWLKL